MVSRRARLRELYRNNGLILGTVALVQQGRMRVRSWFLGRAFNASRLNIGPGVHIRGARFITLGGGFCSKGQLWIEAVSSYYEQNYSPSITIGTDVFCSQNVHISCIEQITIGDYVLIGSGVYIGDHNHGSYRGCTPSSPETPPARRELATLGPLHIGNRVFLGDKVTVLGGLSIGDGAIVAANSVVTRSIPPMCIAAGSPARVVRVYNMASRRWIPADQPPSASVTSA